MEYQIRPLRKSDNRENFNSGHTDLDLFFARYAGQNQFRHHIGVTYVATNDSVILGFITLAMGSIETQSVPKIKIPGNYPLPVLRLGRMAVDRNYQGLGIGKQLLRYALLLALQQKSIMGCVGVVVDIKAEAVVFYEKFGFQVIEQPLEGGVRGNPPPRPMFLPMQSISATP